MAVDQEEELLRRSRAGDAEAFAALIRLHEEPLGALIRRLVSDAHYAEDLRQSTLVAAWRNLGQLEDGSRFGPWLYQIARNRCRDHYRSAQRRLVPEERDVLEERLTRLGVRGHRADEADLEAARAALANIPPAERAAAELHYLAGLTVAEIAKRTGSPEGSVKRRLFQARRRLRERLRRAHEK